MCKKTRERSKKEKNNGYFKLDVIAEDVSYLFVCETAMYCTRMYTKKMNKKKITGI